MIIGSNWEKIPLIKSAKNLNLNILLTDENNDAEGFKYADKIETVNPRNLNKLYTIAKKFRPNGIVADQCDYSHFAAVYLSNKLGLYKDGLSAAQLTTNKLWMREACRNEQVLQPRFFSVKNLKEAKVAINLINFPIVIKPVDNRGSFGVNIVHKLSQLEKCFFDSLANSHSRQLIVESYIEGKHITVDGACDQDGNHYNLAIASKKNMKGSKPIITDVVYPAQIHEDLKKQIFKINSNVVYSLGIKKGLTHSEYIVDIKNRCFLVEMANRGGGGLTSSLIIKNLKNIDLSKLIIKNALGENFDFKYTNKKISVILKFFNFKPGKINKISGVNEINKLKNIVFIKLLIKEGDVLKKPKSGAERHGFIIIKYKTRKELKVIEDKTKKLLRISYDKKK